MTTQLASPAPQALGDDLRPREVVRRVPIIAGVLASALGVVVIVLSYHVAQGTTTGYAYWHIFWLGYALMFGPPAWAAITYRDNPASRTFFLAVVGLTTYVPRFLHAPLRPSANDELGHYLQAQNMFDSSRLFTPNPIITQAPNYPGLETTTVAIRQLTGLGTYQVGTLLVAVMHITVILGVYVLARSLSSAGTATLAALVYATGPQLPFVDSMYAYESVGLPLAVGGLALAAVAARETRPRRRMTALGLVAVLVVACVFTHHVSSFALAGGLIVLSVGWTTWPAAGLRRLSSLPLWVIAVGGLALALGWSAYRHADIVDYLGVYVQNGWHSITAKFGGGDAPQYNSYVPVAAGRTPLSNASKPLYIIAGTYLTELLLLLFAVIGAWRYRAKRSASYLLALVFGFGFFASLPLLYTAGGQNAAHRSWAFSTIGLAMLVGAGLTGAWRWIRARRALEQRSGGHSLADSKGGDFRRPVAFRVMTVVLLIIFSVGGYGAGVSTLLAFPGPFVFQADGRNAPRELYDLADWMSRQGVRGETVLADYRTSLILATMAGALPDVKDAANLVLPIDDPGPQVTDQVRAKASYVVIDSRLTTDVSAAGYYFWGYEPVVLQPLVEQSVSKLARLPWLQVVHQTDHYTVYKVER